MRPSDIEDVILRRAYSELPVDADMRSRISRTIFRLLCREGDVMAWRTAEALGDWVARIRPRDPDYAQEILRRLAWSLNDESGSTPWMSAEAMAEIGVGALDLIEPFVGIILSHYHDVAPRGAIWAAGRIGPLRPDWFQDFIPDLLAALDSLEPTIRGHAVWALGRLGIAIPEEKSALLANDAATFWIYRDGELVAATVSEISV